MKRTTISLPDDLAEFLAREARRRDRSVSGLVRELIEEGLDRRPGEARPVPWAGIFSDSDAPRARDLEEELNAGWADEIAGDRR